MAEKNTHDAKSFALLVGMREADVRDLTKKGVLTAQDGQYEPARSLVALARHLVRTRDTAEAKARAEKARAEFEEQKLAALKKAPLALSDVKSDANKRKCGKWSTAVGERICRAMEEGISLTKAAKAEGVTEGTVRQWAREKPAFATRYALARERQPAAYHDDLDQAVEDAAEAALDPVNATARLMAIRLRIDTRKWQLSKMLPKKYGEHSSVHVCAEPANEANSSPAMASDEAERIVQAIAERQARLMRMQAAEENAEAEDANG